MKDERVYLTLYVLSLIAFIISSYFCLNNIYKKFVLAKETGKNTIILTEGESTKMDVGLLNINGTNTKVASSVAHLKLTKVNNKDQKNTFSIMMGCNSDYTKTLGIDGINEKEYTYEIKKGDIIVVPETEINSFTTGDKILLMKDSIYEDTELNYYITFRFYESSYNQDHLKGTSINTSLYITDIK